MVMHEEHHQPKCSSRPPSRKSKAKKIPQRGLGVAQLEKLRIEEQHKIHVSSSNSEYQPPPLPIPFMNGKAVFIPIPSGMNLQTEPPSNQNQSVNSHSLRDEERIVGTNLPWPFHPEPAVSFPCKVPQFNNPFLKPEESMSMFYGKAPLRFEYKTSGFSKEGASSSNPCQVEWRSSEVHVNKRLKENGVSADNGFLALGSSATHPLAKLKGPVTAPREFSLLQSRGGMENAAKQFGSGKTFYSFLPMRPAAHEMDASIEAEDGVDTSLKL